MSFLSGRTAGPRISLLRELAGTFPLERSVSDVRLGCTGLEGPQGNLLEGESSDALS